MKITYLDEYTYLPESAQQEFRKLGEFIAFNDRPSKEEAISRLRDTDIAILEWTAIDRGMFEKLMRVRYIVVALTGYSFIDTQAAKEYGILVSNIPEYSRQSVAEHAFALLLAVNRKIIPSSEAANAGKREYFEPFLGQELYGKTLGIVGLGSIGSWAAKIGQGFGMKVIGTSRNPKYIPGVEDVNLDTVLQSSDAVIISVDRNRSTERLLTSDKLSTLKKTAVLVSIVSGICDENALAIMLKNGDIAGVGLDVVDENSPLKGLPNAVLTTHIGWYTQDSLDRLMRILIENVRKFIDGKPQNVVNR